MKLKTKALAFAVMAHGAQRRKYTDEPYVVHPMRVAGTLENIGAPECVIAAALLHDVLEDTPVTEAQLREAFGDTVTDLVVEVTDVSRPEDGNRAVRKAKDKDHLANASFWGMSIKIADLIDNAVDIGEHDPKFAKVYRKEKNELLMVLVQGHRGLWLQASKIV